MQKLTAMFIVFGGIFYEGRCTIPKTRNTHTHRRAAAPQHATDHGDRGARGSSGSCSAILPRVLPHLCELLLLCACVRAGADFAA